MGEKNRILPGLNSCLWENITGMFAVLNINKNYSNFTRFFTRKQQVFKEKRLVGLFKVFTTLQLCFNFSGFSLHNKQELPFHSSISCVANFQHSSVVKYIGFFCLFCILLSTLFPAISIITQQPKWFGNKLPYFCRFFK